MGNYYGPHSKRTPPWSPPRKFAGPLTGFDTTHPPRPVITPHPRDLIAGLGTHFKIAFILAFIPVDSSEFRTAPDEPQHVDGASATPIRTTAPVVYAKPAERPSCLAREDAVDDARTRREVFENKTLQAEVFACSDNTRVGGGTVMQCQLLEVRICACELRIEVRAAHRRTIRNSQTA